MCVETMDTKSTNLPSNYLRKHKFVSKMKWKMLRVRPAAEDTFDMLHKTAKNAARRQCVGHNPKRSTLTKLGKGVRHVSDNERANRSATMARADVALTRCRSGAMAPENTTQYLMANVYDDMSRPLCDALAPHGTPADVYGESSPTSVSAALDSVYDDYLAFQQRDFEEVFGLLS